MWAHSPRAKQKLPEASLSPRRPRTPLKITRDLAGLLAAQELQPYDVVLPPPQKGSKSDVRRGASPSSWRGASPDVWRSGSPSTRRAGSCDTHRPLPQHAGGPTHSDNARPHGRAPVSQHAPLLIVGASSEPTGYSAKEMNRRLRGQTFMAMAGDTAADDACIAGGVVKPSSARLSVSGKLLGSKQLANHHRSNTSSRRTSAHPVTYKIESRARAREPAETQRLSGDLQLLEAATNKPKTEPTSAVLQNAVTTSRPTVTRRSSGLPVAERERPWRATIPRRITNVLKASALFKKSISAGESGQKEPTENIKKASTDGPDPLGMPLNKGGPVGVAALGAELQDRRKGSKEDSTRRSLWKVSVDCKMPVDVVKVAFDLFKACAVLRSEESAQPNVNPDVTESILTREAFAEVLTTISGGDKIDDDVLELQFRSLAQGEEDINFAKFALWYSERGFSEAMLLTAEERKNRSIARRLNITDSFEMDRMKRIFDQYHVDGTGIAYPEFEKLLHAILKVPAHLELPVSRVKQFWRSSDVDDSGEICFEEFLVFYMNVFNTAEEENTSPLEAFYHGFRPNAMRGPLIIPPGTGVNPRKISRGPSFFES